MLRQLTHGKRYEGLLHDVFADGTWRVEVTKCMECDMPRSHKWLEDVDASQVVAVDETLRRESLGRGATWIPAFEMLDNTQHIVLHLSEEVQAAIGD